MATAPKNNLFFQRHIYGDNCLHEVKEGDSIYYWFPIKVYGSQYDKGKGLAASPDFNLKAITMTGFKGTNNNWLLMSVEDSVIGSTGDDVLCTLEVKEWDNNQNKFNFKKEESEKNLKLWKAKQGSPGNLVCLLIDKEKLPVLHTIADILAEEKMVCRTPGANPISFPKDYAKCNLKEEEIREYYSKIISAYKSSTREEIMKQFNTAGSDLSLIKDKLLANGIWLLLLPTRDDVIASKGAVEKIERDDGLGVDTVERVLPLREDNSVIFTEPAVSDPKSKSGGYGYGGGGSTNNISVTGEITLTEKVKQTTESLSSLVALFNDPHLETLVQLKKVNPDKWKLILELVNGVYIPETTTTFLPDKKVLESLQQENLYQNYPVIAPSTPEDNGEKKTLLTLNSISPSSSYTLPIPTLDSSVEVPDIQERIRFLMPLINLERTQSGLSQLTEQGLTSVFVDHSTDKEEYTKVLFKVYRYNVNSKDKQEYLHKIGSKSQCFYQLQTQTLNTVLSDLDLAVNTFKYLHQV